MRKLDKYLLYLNPGKDIYIPKTGCCVLYISEFLSSGLSTLNNLDLGPLLKELYIPRIIKLPNKTFSYKEDNLKKYVSGDTSNKFRLVRILNKNKYSFVYDITPGIYFLHKKYSGIEYTRKVFSYIDSLIDTIKKNKGEDFKIILLDNIGDEVSKRVIDSELYINFFLKSLLIKKYGTLNADYGFVCNSNKFTLIHKKGLGGSVGRVKSVLTTYISELVYTDNSSIANKDESNSSLTNNNVLEKNIDNDDILTKFSVENKKSKLEKEESFLISNDDEMKNITKNADVTESDVELFSEIASEKYTRYSEKSKDEFKKEISEIFKRRPEDLKTLKKYYVSKDPKSMVICLDNVLKEYTSEIYPENNLASRQVLSNLDEWSDKKGLTDNVELDPVLNEKILGVSTESNLHRVIAQKQQTWDNMNVEVYNASKKVLEDSGFKLLSVNIIDKKPKDRQIEKSYFSEIQLKVKNTKTGKNKLIKFMIPTLIEGRYHIQGGIRWLFPTVLATLPIFVVKKYKVQFRSNYAPLTFEYKKHLNKEACDVFVGGNKIPLLLWFLQIKTFNQICSDFGITYNFVNNRKELNSEYYIKLPDKRYLEFYIRPENFIISSIIINDLNRILRKYKDDVIISFDMLDNGKIINSFTGKENTFYILGKIKRYIMDSRTSDILNSRGIDPEIFNVSKICVDLAIRGVEENKMSIKNVQLRLMDMVPAEVEKGLHYAVTEYKRRSLIDPDTDLTVNEGWVINSLRQNVVLLPYKDNNPTTELSQMMSVRIVGPGGFSKVDSVQQKDRNIQPSHFGQIDPVDTAEGNPGIQLSLSQAFEYDPENITFTEVEPNESFTNIFGTSAGQIPFVSCDDGNRAQYGSSQIRQVVPLVNSEPPLCGTGMETMIPYYVSSKFVKKAEFDGEVKYLDKNVMVVEYDNGKLERFDIRDEELVTGSGKSNALSHTPLVSIGDKIKKNQILTKNQFINKSYSSGINTLCCYMTLHGYSYEDGVVISESFSKKYVSLHYETLDLKLDSPDELKYWPLMKLKDTGKMEYKEGEEIAVIQSSTLGEYYENKIYAPVDCYVSDIEVYPYDSSFIPILDDVDEQLYSKTNSVLNQFKLNPLYDKKNLVDNKGKFMFRKEPLDRNLIRIRIVEKREVGMGDKLNNRHGNKGVVTKILPDDQMPQLPDGRHVDCVFNPLGVISRMNLGQLHECHIGNILIAATEKLKTFTDYNKARNFLCELYTLLDGDPDKKISKKTNSYLKSLSGNMLKEIIDKLKITKIHMIFPPFKVPKIEDVRKAASLVGTELESYLLIPKYNRRTKNKVTWGYITVNRLEHISELKRKTRSVGKYSTTTLQPVRGGGHGIDVGGLKIGEMDSNCYLSYDALDLLKEFFTINGDNPILKKKVLNDIILNGEASIKGLENVEKIGSQHMFEVLTKCCGLEI